MEQDCSSDSNWLYNYCADCPYHLAIFGALPSTGGFCCSLKLLEDLVGGF